MRQSVIDPLEIPFGPAGLSLPPRCLRCGGERVRWHAYNCNFRVAWLESLPGLVGATFLVGYVRYRWHPIGIPLCTDHERDFRRWGRRRLLVGLVGYAGVFGGLFAVLIACLRLDAPTALFIGALFAEVIVGMAAIRALERRSERRAGFLLEVDEKRRRLLVHNPDPRFAAAISLSSS